MVVRLFCITNVCIADRRVLNETFSDKTVVVFHCGRWLLSAAVRNTATGFELSLTSLRNERHGPGRANDTIKHLHNEQSYMREFGLHSACSVSERRGHACGYWANGRSRRTPAACELQRQRESDCRDREWTG